MGATPTPPQNEILESLEENIECSLVALPLPLESVHVLYKQPKESVVPCKQILSRGCLQIRVGLGCGVPVVSKLTFTSCGVEHCYPLLEISL
jgi:hypothetical protein